VPPRFPSLSADRERHLKPGNSQTGRGVNFRLPLRQPKGPARTANPIWVRR